MTFWRTCIGYKFKDASKMKSRYWSRLDIRDRVDINLTSTRKLDSQITIFSNEFRKRYRIWNSKRV